MKYTLVTTRKEVGVGDHGLGAEEENGLRTGLRPDRSGLVARGCRKKRISLAARIGGREWSQEGGWLR